MIQEQQRALIVAEARSWSGTPYHSNGDIKGVGVDCGMLLVRIFVDLGFVTPFDPRPYPPDWHLHRDDPRYLRFVRDHMYQVSVPLPGDVVVFRFGRAHAHGGVVTSVSPLTVVHALVTADRVMEDILLPGSELLDRDPIYFSMWSQE